MAIYCYYNSGAVLADGTGDTSSANKAGYLSRPLQAGPFEGYTATDLATNKTKSDRKDFKFYAEAYAATQGVAILSSSGVHLYSLVGHTFTETLIPGEATLSGFDQESPSVCYYGKTLQQLLTLDKRKPGRANPNPIIGVNLRWVSATKWQLTIQDCHGFHYFNDYDPGTGKNGVLSSESWRDLNVRIRSGPFDGKWYSDLCHYRTDQKDTTLQFVRAGMTCSGTYDLQFMTRDGVVTYDLVSGNFDKTCNPKLVGGPPSLSGKTLGTIIAEGRLINQCYNGMLSISEDPLAVPNRIDS
jgi:hypothetical protein